MNLKKSDDKSLIIYTSLIFLAAIGMIILSFFGQKHLDDERVSDSKEEIVTLANKNAAVSDENLQLIDLNKSLKAENDTLKTDNTNLTNEKDALVKENENFKALHKVSEQLIEGDKKEALELLKEIPTKDLTMEQKVIFDYLADKAQN